MEEFYGWLFHYNYLSGKYEAVHRDHYNDLWNGGPNVFRDEDESVLKRMILNTLKK